MLFRWRPLVVWVLFSVVIACADSEANLVYHVVVPEEFKDPNLPNNLHPPNGDPEPVRYTKAHEAFWWNCVIVKAENLNARCPFICSGTPGAASGCGDGASDAEGQISDLLKTFPASQVQSYLGSLASSPDARKKLQGYGYFPDGPHAETVEN